MYNMPHAAHLGGWRRRLLAGQPSAFALQGKGWGGISVYFVCHKQHTWEAGARGCKLGDPLLVGTHAAWPAETPALQVRGCAQAKGIILCIPLPVHLIVLAPAGRCASWSGSQISRHYALIHADSFAGPDAALLTPPHQSLPVRTSSSTPASFITYSISCKISDSTQDGCLHLCPGLAKFEIS